MRPLVRIILVCLLAFSLAGCGEDPKPKVTEPDWDRLTAAKGDGATQPPQAVESTTSTKSTGGVSVKIMPQEPSSRDCLSLMVTGQPGSSAVRWKVNGQIVSGQTGRKFCGDFFKRDDQVTVEVGTVDVGASMTVVIGNAPPSVVDISATPDEVFAGSPVTVSPVGEDVDGDDVDFNYQWLVNGNADDFLNEATLPGNVFSQGDTIQELMTPTDGTDEGEVYQSFPMTITNAPPVFTSVPPQSFEAYEYTYQVEVSDPDDTAFTFTLNDPPAGMTISESGFLRWALTEAEPGDHTISITVTDADGDSATQEYAITLDERVQGSEQ